MTSRGRVADAERDRAHERVGALDHYVSDPVLGARVVLRYEPNRRLERPARAEAELNVNGHMLRGRVASATMAQAIDELGRHLERQLNDFVDRRARLERRAGGLEPGEWHHGASSPPRPSYFPRPVQERSLVRRKTFALGTIDPLQAVSEMLALDHDFYLYLDAETGADAVAYHRDDGRIGVIYPDGDRPRTVAGDGPVWEASRLKEPITLEAAVAEMNALNHRFMFFTSAETARGNVIYLRYDGNYGLIVPAE
ncbi:MAG: HPF/RaiA family ribosome-associated protein [Solirubrobacterales bacterium]